MLRLISFVSADSSCEPREESENYKMKILANYLSLTRLVFLFDLAIGQKRSSVKKCGRALIPPKHKNVI